MLDSYPPSQPLPIWSVVFATSDIDGAEFASALGLKVWTRMLQLDQARQAQKLFEKLAAQSLHVHVPTRADYLRATAFLGEYGLGLRKLKIKTGRPI